MLDHLHIQNYRLFKDLKIDKLGQVNLIAGKNNTGKTALLEALRIYFSEGEGSVINNIIYKRGDWEVNRDFKMYSSLFPNKDMEEPKLIKINNLSFGIADELQKGYILYQIENKRQISSMISYENPLDNAIYIGIEITNENNTKFWENISLTPKEDEVVNIIKILDSRISKIRIDNGNSKVLLNEEKFPIPLKNLGDGISRLLTLALALVNAKNKTLIIDEFEVGLHHSVQEQLWDIIFKYAKEWNIQVFATTHSQDTVKAFSYISSKEEYKDMGQYMRLQPSRKTGEIEAVIYPQDSLENSLDLNLETR